MSYTRARYLVEIVTAADVCFHKPFTEEFSALRCYARHSLMVGPAIVNVRLYDRHGPAPTLMRDANSDEVVPPELMATFREAATYLEAQGLAHNFATLIARAAA